MDTLSTMIALGKIRQEAKERVNRDFLLSYALVHAKLKGKEMGLPVSGALAAHKYAYKILVRMSEMEVGYLTFADIESIVETALQGYKKRYGGVRAK